MTTLKNDGGDFPLKDLTYINVAHLPHLVKEQINLLVSSLNFFRPNTKEIGVLDFLEASQILIFLITSGSNQVHVF